jgi:cytochrome bd ubiquinol oxidase subunit II
MTLQDLLGVVLGFALTAYALFAGADFGAGILDLTAPRHDAERAAIAAGIDPVWEANHVWLIFSITILFSAFPQAISALGTALLAPFTIALLAIVVRGAALGLRSSQERRNPAYARLGLLFGAASLAAPLAFGMVAGGLAQASTRTTPSPGIPWTGLVAIVVGLLAVALCTQLAACFMTQRLARGGQQLLAESFRRRGLQSGVGVLALAALALIVASWKAPSLSNRLLTTALPLVITGAVAITVSLAGLARRRYGIARVGSLVTGAALVWGWFVAQTPHLVGVTLTLHTAAASHSALAAIAIASGIVLLTVLPSFYLLFTVFDRSLPEATE